MTEVIIPLGLALIWLAWHTWRVRRMSKAMLTVLLELYEATEAWNEDARADRERFWSALKQARTVIQSAHAAGIPYQRRGQ